MRTAEWTLTHPARLCSLMPELMSYSIREIGIFFGMTDLSHCYNWHERIDPDTPIQSGMRISVLKPLRHDPKMQRLRRLKSQKTGKPDSIITN